MKVESRIVSSVKRMAGSRSRGAHIIPQSRFRGCCGYGWGCGCGSVVRAREYEVKISFCLIIITFF